MATLNEIRTRKAFSISHLSEKTGVSRNTIFRIEHGMPSRFVTRRKLAKALGVKPEDIEW